MRILLISPYHGGSHRAWAEGYARQSAHHVELLTLPARFWKWRMHGGAVTLARLWLGGDVGRGGSETRPYDGVGGGRGGSETRPYTRNDNPDLILATDLLDLTTFLALTRQRTAGIPAAVYMHENQLTYPLPDDPTTGPMRRQLGERDRHYAFINYASMLAADRVFFNSRYHLETFFDALLPFLRHYPEYNELETIDLLRQRSEVLPVGIDLRRLEPPPPPEDPALPPLILWNQRLEFDKNPERFMAALLELAEEGRPFRVALCGERFGRPSEAWQSGVAALGERVVHNGYANNEQYRQLLWQAALTFSTADHEYFGISILEAAYAETLPLLPTRLSYPEIIPLAFHGHCLYRGRADLLARLRRALDDPAATRAVARELAAAVAVYDWQTMGPLYDRILEGTGGVANRE
jgi:glycosyltransferase involved in cell wall biosynthesis